MLTEAHFKVFEKYKTAGGHAFSNGTVTEEDKDRYQDIFGSLRSAAEFAIEKSPHSQYFKILTCRFHRNGGIQGQRPVDLWVSVVNTDSGSFDRYPQVYLIASDAGLEIGFAVAIHESDYYNVGIKQRSRRIVPILYDKFPQAGSSTVTELASKLRSDGGWQFGLKTRQGANGSLGGIGELIAFLKSPDRNAQGGGAIYRIFKPTELAQADFNLDTYFSDVLNTFAPLMRLLTPTAGDEKRITEFEPQPEVTEAGSEVGVLQRRIWLYAPGTSAAHWEEFYRDGVMGIGWETLGDLSHYASLDEIATAHAATIGRVINPGSAAKTCFDFVREIGPGDIVYVKKGTAEIVGRGVVTGPYEWRAGRSYFNSVRRVEWDAKGSWSFDGELPTSTLTDITENVELVAELDLLVGSVAEPNSKVDSHPVFTVDDAMKGLFLPRSEFEEFLDIWRLKKNLILQGAPGVGKSFVAKRLANTMIGRLDADRVEAVQFHQSYSYEDFVQGYRPSTSGLNLQNGVFFDFCKRASLNLNANFVFIIDEINRGNLSKIFGELMLLVECDKRGPEWGTRLMYGERNRSPFYVPSNLYILGLMNTADRSLSMVDYALRRRFAFATLKPEFSSPGFRSHLLSIGASAGLVDKIVSRMNQLNEIIESDTSNLGPGFCIGHSFFVAQEGTVRVGESWYQRIVKTEIGPLLREYWFDNPGRVEECLSMLTA